MANNELLKLLDEWKHYEILKNTLPSHIARSERKSIAHAIESTLKKIEKNKESYEVSDEQKELIEEIMVLLKNDDFD